MTQTPHYKIRVAETRSGARSVPSLAASRPPRGGRGDAPQRERNPWRTAFLILLAILIGFSSGWATMNFGPSHLQFSVTDALSGNPVSDAIVSIYNHGELAARCLTQEGECSVSVAPGSYQGAIASSNYSSKQFRVNAQGAFNVYALTVTPSFSTVIQPGSQVSDIQQIVFTDSTNWFSRDRTGSVVSGSDAATIINGAVSALSSGRTWIETVTVIGVLTQSTQITIPSYTVLDLRRATVTLATSFPQTIGIQFASGATNATLLGGDINGNAPGQSGSVDCVDALSNQNNVTVDGVTIHNCKLYAVRFFSSTTRATLRNSIIYSTSNGVLAQAAYSVISGNQFLGNTGLSVQTKGNQAVTGNLFQLSNAPSTAAILVNLAGAANLLIDSNRFVLSGSVAYAVYVQQSNNVTVSNNLITSAAYSGNGITFIGASSGVTVNGNQLYQMSINFEESTGTGGTGYTINNNRVVFGWINFITDSGIAGIWNYFTINGNQIQGDNSRDIGCINIRAQNGTVVGNTCANSASTTYAGIQLYGTTPTLNVAKNVTVEANTITGCLYGIRENNGANFNLIQGNTLAGDTNPVVATGSKSIVRWNLGYKTEASGNQSVTGAVTTVTVTHGLVGTPLLILVTGMQTGIGLYAVTARGATTFVITFANQPGGSTWNFQWYAQTWNYP